MRITQKNVEDVLKNAINPVTSTEITQQITRIKLILEDDDAKVRRYLSRLISYNMLAITGFNEDKEPYFQYKYKTTDAFNNSIPAVYETLRTAGTSLTLEEVCARLFSVDTVAEFMAPRIHLVLDKGTQGNKVIRDNSTAVIKYRAGPGLSF